MCHTCYDTGSRLILSHLKTFYLKRVCALAISGQFERNEEISIITYRTYTSFSKDYT
jgi:hypothetical protein